MQICPTTTRRGPAVGWLERQGLHSAGRGFGGKQVTASRRKMLTDERRGDLVGVGCCFELVRGSGQVVLPGTERRTSLRGMESHHQNSVRSASCVPVKKRSKICKN